MDDLQLQETILDELKFEPSINAAHIGVAVDNGVVTLSGHVGSYAEKTQAVAAARRVKGVRAIADDIAVRMADDKKTSDDEIAKRAVALLNWDVTIPANRVQVTVRNGWVTLGGDVDWQYQRRSAEEDVRKLSGVNGVTVAIAVKPHVRACDVKNQIEDALRRRAEDEAHGITVRVDGTDSVILEGKVQNWDEFFAVENAAWSAPGVKAVDVRLKIA